jgi:hypothetical protein
LANEIIEVFQYTEVDDGLKAVPASPIPPARESGVIAIKGKAVVIVFNCKSLSEAEPPVG